MNKRRNRFGLRPFASRPNKKANAEADQLLDSDEGGNEPVAEPEAPQSAPEDNPESAAVEPDPDPIAPGETPEDPAENATAQEPAGDNVQVHDSADPEQDAPASVESPPNSSEGEEGNGPLFDSIDDDDADSGEQVLDAGDDPDLQALESFAAQQLRSMVVSALLEWAEDGENTFDDLESFLVGVVDADEDGEVSDDEQALYEAAQDVAIDALTYLGGSPKVAVECLEKEDDDCAAELYDAINASLNDNEMSDDEIVNSFVMQTPVFHDAMERVVRGGKVLTRRRPLRRKRLSSRQRQALKKARRRSNNSAARLARKKSMRLRKARGL